MGGVADMVLSTVGEPDGYIVEHWRRHRRALKRTWWICGTLAIAVLIASPIAFIGLDLEWWFFFVPGLALIMLALPLDRTFELPRRAGPESPREIAVVVGVEIITWGNARDDRHLCRIIARPVGSATDALVHAYGYFPTEMPFPVRIGMLIGFRRFATMRHHVWLDDTLTPAEAARMRLGGQFSTAAIEVGEVAQVEVLQTDPVGDWWLTRTTLCAENGSLPVDVTHRLPEELAEFESGTTVHFVRHHGQCAILPAVPRTTTE